MIYTTFEPCAELEGLVKCYWTLGSPREEVPEKQRIVPDGCMEMIFHMGDLYLQYTPDGGSIVQPRCFVFGQITRLLEIEPTGSTEIFSVRFYPGGFTPFASLPLSAMENRAVPLEEVFPSEGDTLQAAMLKAPGHEERIKVVEAFLLNRLHRPEIIDRVVRESVASILSLKGQLSVGELSEQVSINRRQLERKFSSVVGLSPKQLAKMVRMQATLKLLANKQVSSLTALAYEGDYYDQAHFTRDFKEFTGMTPGKFFTGNLQMSSLFIGNE